MNFPSDFQALAEAIVQALIDGLQKWLSPIPETFLHWLGDQITLLWNDIWNSGANLLDTPFDLTLNYPPAQMLGHNLALMVWAITSLAIVLLGLRNLWYSFTGNSFLHDSANGLLIGILLAGGSTIIVGQAYALTALASNAIGRFNYVPAFEPKSLLDLGPSFVVSLFTLTVMMIYGWKLMLRAAYRIVLLMFLTPFAPVAGILYGIPQTRWIATAYYITLGGWLAGGFLAIGAISLGVQIVGFSTGGLLVLIFGVALVQLAYDLMVIIPRWAFGQFRPGGMSIPNVAAATAGAAVGGAVGGGMGGAAGGTAGAAIGNGVGLGAGTASIGALPLAALGPGYD
jgi:hypothetical protein